VIIKVAVTNRSWNLELQTCLQQDRKTLHNGAEVKSSLFQLSNSTQTLPKVAANNFSLTAFFSLAISPERVVDNNVVTFLIDSHIRIISLD